MTQLGSLHVIGNGTLTLHYTGDLISRDKEELRILINESPDQPGAGNPVDVGVLSRDPLHR